MKEWCESASTATGIPFYYTINLQQDPKDDAWFTIQFNSIDHEGNFCKLEYMELGFIDVILLSTPGKGDLIAITALESIVPVLMDYADPNRRLTLESYEPIQEYSRGDADSTYRVGVQINYRYNIT